VLDVKKNMGGTDRSIRVIAALVIAALVLTRRVGGIPAIVLGIVAGAFVATGLLGWCPAYLPLGMSTCKRDAAPEK
jgi:Inner membrane protein YgaP-like, transmembrane domain